MKVLVVGGAGYIGSHAVFELIRAGHEVVIYDNLSTGYREMIHPDARFYLGDTLNPDQFDDVFRVECAEKPFDAVMHFAAKLVVPESVTQPLTYYHNNVEGVRVMLETMMKHNVKHVIFSSTAAVYGEADGVCHEDDECKPINPYGASKLAAEDMIRWVCRAHDMTWGIFRYFNVAGADDSLKIGLYKDQITHLIPVTLQAALGIRESMTIFGTDYPTPDGSCIRDYIHVTDLVQAHILGAQHLVDGKKSFTINLGSGTGYSVREVVEATQKIIDVPFVEGPRRDGDPAALTADPSRAYEILGWKATRTLDEMIASDLAYRKARQERLG